MSAVRNVSHPAPRPGWAKLNPAPVVAAQVLRSEISEPIAAAAAKLVLVRAPSGRETTAMAQVRQHMEADGLATAWLTLTEPTMTYRVS